MVRRLLHFSQYFFFSCLAVTFLLDICSFGCCHYSLVRQVHVLPSRASQIHVLVILMKSCLFPDPQFVTLAYAGTASACFASLLTPTHLLCLVCRYPGVVNIGMCADQFKSTKATKNTASITQFFQPPCAQSQARSCDEHDPAVKDRPSSMPNTAGRSCEADAECEAVVKGRSETAQCSVSRQQSKTGIEQFFCATSGQSVTSTENGGDVEVFDTNCHAAGSDCSNSNSTDWQQCDQCGTLVSAWQLPEHLDFHYAQALQAEEHSSSRAEASQSRSHSSSAVSAPAAKRLKTPQKVKQKQQSSTPISSFFTKKSPKEST